MGLLVYPVFSNSNVETKPRTSGEHLAREFKTVDRIAIDHGLEPVSSFSDAREIPQGFDAPSWELEQTLGPSHEWFPASKGMAAFAAIALLIREKPEVARRLDSAREVASELEDLCRGLAIAESVGAEFRLELG